MKAIELRIGNIVLRPNGLPQISKPIRIDVVRAIGVLGELDLGWREYLADKCCGLPLTDEILTEWCGFTISPCQGFYFDVDNELQIYITRNHAISLINRQDEGEHYLLRKIMFLHQLQNLYFALTGEELEVKLPTSPTQA